MNLLVKLGINILAIIISVGLGSIISFPLWFIFTAISKSLKYKIFARALSLLSGASVGTFTILVAFYFLKFFSLSLNWWLVIVIILGFIYNDWGRHITPNQDKEVFYEEIFMEIGIIVGILATSVYLIR